MNWRKAVLLLTVVTGLHLASCDQQREDSIAFTNVNLVTMTNLTYALRWRDEIRAGTRAGPTIYASSMLLYASPLGDPEKIVRQNHDQGFDFLKLYSYLSVEDFHAAMQAAKGLGMYTAGHIPYAVGLDGVPGGLHDAGVPLLLGTDSGTGGMGIVTGYSIHDELSILVENGFSPYEALGMGTVNAAGVVESMTGDGDFGTIEVGKRADLILAAKNPLQDISSLRTPLGVMAAGRWYSRETLADLINISGPAGPAQPQYR